MKNSIVGKLKEKYKDRLILAEKDLNENYKKGNPKEQPYFNQDVMLFQKWAYRVEKNWYGFSINGIPNVWIDIINDFLKYVEVKCSKFKILQQKIKFGQFCCYLDLHCKNKKICREVYDEIQKLEDLLQHKNLIY